MLPETIRWNYKSGSKPPVDPEMRWTLAKLNVNLRS